MALPIHMIKQLTDEKGVARHGYAVDATFIDTPR